MSGHIGVRFIDMPSIGPVTDETRIFAANAGAGSVTAETLRAWLLPDVANVRDFGAVGDGVTNDGPAIQAALDTGRNVFIPRGDYAVGQTLRYVAAWQRVLGEGSRSGGGSRLLFGGALTQWLVADSDTAGLLLTGCGLAEVALTSAAYAPATGLTLNKASLFLASDIAITNANRCADSFGSRSTSWTRCVFSAKRLGGWCLRLKGASGNTGGIAVITECRWDCADTGYGPIGLGHEADGLVIEGAVATVTTYSLQIVRPRRAFWTIGGTEGAGVTLNPYFLYNYDFQSDSTGENAIRLDVATDVVFDRGWCQGGIQGSNVLVAAGVKKFRYRGYVGGGQYNGFDLAGEDIALSDLSCGRSSASLYAGAPGNNTHDNVVIRSAAVGVSILGGRIGGTENGSGLARYGVNVEAGATKIRIVGVDMTGNISGALNDGTAGEVGVVECRGPTPRLTATTTSLLELGNQKQSMLRVGNTTAGTYPNILRAAGGVAGQPARLLAEGDDAVVGISLEPKGAGTVSIDRAVALTVAATGAITGASVGATGAVTGATVTATGTVTGATVAATGTVTAPAVTATGQVQGATVVATGTVTAPAVTATSLHAAGTTLLGLGNQAQTSLQVGNPTAVAGVNYLRILSGAVGISPELQSHGFDASVGLEIRAKGTGPVTVTGGGVTLAAPAVSIGQVGGAVGFFGAAAAAKPTLNGNWGTDPSALGKALAQTLAALGLIVDNSTNV